MSAAVVLDDLRVTDGNVSSPLLKISHGIALSGHHARNQAVRFNQAPVWIIYKSALNLTPSFQKVAVFCRSESVDVKALRPFCAVLKRGFGSPTISCLGHCERVLWTEVLSQESRAPLKETRNIDANDYSYDKGDRDCYCVHVIDLPLVKAWFRAGDAPIAKPQTGSKRRRK
jgi:hypothetical protein